MIFRNGMFSPSLQPGPLRTILLISSINTLVTSSIDGNALSNNVTVCVPSDFRVARWRHQPSGEVYTSSPF
ncbi:hypothetical protein VTO42DRAFT_2725 [Malbranchea cinnamomea]